MRLQRMQANLAAAGGEAGAGAGAEGELRGPEAATKRARDTAAQNVTKSSHLKVST